MQTEILLFVILAAIIGMIYSLRKILLLEKKILNMEDLILRLEKKIVGKRKKK